MTNQHIYNIDFFKTVNGLYNYNTTIVNNITIDILVEYINIQMGLKFGCRKCNKLDKGGFHRDYFANVIGDIFNRDLDEFKENYNKDDITNLIFDIWKNNYRTWQEIQPYNISSYYINPITCDYNREKYQRHLITSLNLIPNNEKIMYNFLGDIIYEYLHQ